MFHPGTRSGDPRGVEPRETFEDGLVVNSVIDAAYRSMASGRWEAVEVPTLSGTAAR